VHEIDIVMEKVVLYRNTNASIERVNFIIV